MSKPLSFNGPFSVSLHEFINLKQSVGYKFETGALHRFDRFTGERYPTADRLTKDIVLDWCRKRPYEASANRTSRASIIRQFGVYLDSLGCQAYILPKGAYPKGPNYVPHIYTEDELQRFFAQTDSCRYCVECPHRHVIMPVFFRMIYTCGLRVSEARMLKVGDVDLNEGILTISQAKKDNDRLVPMAESLLKRCRTYADVVHSSPDEHAYFFPARNEAPMTLMNVYHNFRKFLWQAGISHGGRGKGPRIHDFRHTYACHCLKRWAKQGKDLSAYLPLLKTYLGHDSFHETAYYLRLTADVFTDITIRVEGKYPDLLPKLEGAADAPH
jgi:integrase